MSMGGDHKTIECVHVSVGVTWGRGGELIGSLIARESYFTKFIEDSVQKTRTVFFTIQEVFRGQS